MVLKASQDNFDITELLVEKLCLACAFLVDLIHLIRHR